MLNAMSRWLVTYIAMVALVTGEQHQENNYPIDLHLVVICGYSECMETSTISPQQISRIIGKTNIMKSHVYKSGRKGQGRRSTEGFSVYKGIEGIVVNYTSTHSNSKQDLRRIQSMQTITTTLAELGFTFEASTIWPNAIVIKAGN